MKKSKLKLMSAIISVMMSATLVTTAKGEEVKAYGENDFKNLKQALLSQLETEIKLGDKFSGVEGLEVDNENSTLEELGNPEEKVRVIVELVDIPATLKLEDGIQPSEELIESVKEAQIPIQEEVVEKTGEEVRHTFGDLINGFSIEVKRKDIDEIKEIDGVVDVKEVNIYYPDVNSAKEFTEALAVWNDYGYKGEGLVVSVIDTGIDPSHKDMKLTDVSKAKLNEENTNKGEGKFYTDKVPYGYNFADENDEIRDIGGSMHGMHVAGIVAANASEEEVNNNLGVQGVAPEAQVLAMKVFTNNPEIEGAYADDIIAALEASVELDADVINMSLGSSSGYREANDPEQIAIKNATDDGVICVVSAGNSATSLNPYIVEGISDIGVVGSPGIATDALQVASSENSIITLPAFKLIIGDNNQLVGYTKCDIDPTDIFSSDKNLQLVECGFGNVSDFVGKDLKGKVALVSRGEITFVEKQINAQAAGASAVIIYNNVGNAAHINMATDSSMKIPAMFIAKEVADEIKENINEATISFNGDVANVVNPSAALMSDFTSWGGTPNLEFTPQITGPGGNIYSTLNNNKYGSMSGTSMSAPHVAGATALIIQGIKDNGIDLEGRELVEFVKKTIINTANTLTETNAFGEKNIPYSPRRQGSGMIQTKKAIDNRVLVTGDDGQATVGLKEIGNKTTFKLTLTNYGDSDEKYTVETLGDVLTAFTPSMIGQGIFSGIMAFDTVLDGAEVIFNKNEVIVPANGVAEVEVTLNVLDGSVSNNFVEGFIKFVSENEETPSLVVPYMGYYGDWTEETIIDGAIWEDETVNISPSFAATSVLGKYNYLGYDGRDAMGNVVINSDKIAISPNEDSMGDEFVPALYLLRNAKEVSVDLLDENKNIVAKNINSGSDLRKKIFSNTNGSSASIYSDISWDGKLYNNETGNEEVVTEGQYYLNYKARVDSENEVYQDFIMPVKVDITPVTVNLLSENKVEGEDYKLELDFNSELENGTLNEFAIAVNGEVLGNDKLAESIIEGDKLYLNLTLVKDSVNTVEVVTIDNAYNVGSSKFNILVGETEASVKINDFPHGNYVGDNELLITGDYSGPVGELLINGEAPDTMKDGKFTKLVVLEEGKNVISLYATDMLGNVIANYGYKIYCDTLAPELTLVAPVTDENGVLVTANDSVVVKGYVSDKSEGYTLYLNGEKKIIAEVSGGNEINNYREFEYEVSVVDGDIITVKAVDLVGNEAVKQIKVVVDKTVPTINIEGVENNKAYNLDVTPIITVDSEEATLEMTLNGEEYTGNVISEEGNYELVVKVVGINGVENIKRITFVIDKTSPIVNIEGVEDGKAYNKDLLPNIIVEDNTDTVITLNGEEYESTAITEEGNYELKVVSVDNALNTTEVLVAFVVDKTKPEITVEGLIDGMKYNKEIKPTITVNEESEITVTLNDKEYNGAPIKEDGEYTLKVVAVDKAGNVSEVVFDFTIKLPTTSPENPTPTPTPTPTPGPSGDKENDDKGQKPSSNGNKGNSTNLPQTGGVNSAYLIVVALVIIAAGGVVLYKKKAK